MSPLMICLTVYISLALLCLLLSYYTYHRVFFASKKQKNADPKQLVTFPEAGHDIRFMVDMERYIQTVRTFQAAL